MRNALNFADCFLPKYLLFWLLFTEVMSICTLPSSGIYLKHIHMLRYTLSDITNNSESIDCFISFDALFVNVTAKICLNEKSSAESNLIRIFFLSEKVFPVPALASIILYLYDNFF